MQSWFKEARIHLTLQTHTRFCTCNSSSSERLSNGCRALARHDAVASDTDTSCPQCCCRRIGGHYQLCGMWNETHQRDIHMHRPLRHDEGLYCVERFCQAGSDLLLARHYESRRTFLGRSYICTAQATQSSFSATAFP